MTTCLTVCVTGRWAGVDNALEQEKPEARKMLVELYPTCRVHAVLGAFGKTVLNLVLIHHLLHILVCNGY